MTKGNKIRLFIWGFIWLCVLAAVGVGIYSFYKGYGVYGKIRQELLPIEKAFNNLNGIQRYKNSNVTIKTSINKNYLIVSYKAEKIKLSLNFEYKIIDGKRVLYLKFNDSYQVTTEFIIKEMIEAISVLNNRKEGEIFNKIEFDDLYDYTLDKGVNLIYDNINQELFINIDESLANNIIEKVTTYITYYDIKNINDDLFAYGKFDYSKYEITLHVVNYDDSYAIYIQNSSYNNDLYKSLLSVIYALNLDETTKSDFELNYPEITDSKEFGNYIITVGADVTDLDEFINKDNVVKVEILKKKELNN